MSIELSNIAAALDKIHEPLADLVARNNPLLAALPKRAVATSDQIYLPSILSSNHNARPIADGSDVVITANTGNVYQSAALPWATYVSEVSINKRTLAQASGNPGVLSQLLLLEIQGAAQDLADRIQADLWGGTTANGLVGMQTVISDTGTYAGIDRSLAANANYRSVVEDAGNTEISPTLLRNLDTKFFNRNKYGFLERPARFTGITSAEFMARYQGLLTDVSIALNTGTVPAIQASALNRGMLQDFGSLVGYLGIPFMRDPNVGAGAGDTAGTSRLYILDTSYWFLATLNPDPTQAELHRVAGAVAAPEVDGLRFDFELLANTGERVNGYLKAYVQLVCTDPAKGGCLLKNVDVTP